jgi:hypothetical protein
MSREFRIIFITKARKMENTKMDELFYFVVSYFRVFVIGRYF